MDSQSSGGAWGGAWAVGTGPTGEPARYFCFNLIVPNVCTVVNPPKHPKDVDYRKTGRFIPLFPTKNIFLIFPDQNRLFPVGNALNRRNNEPEGGMA